MSTMCICYKIQKLQLVDRSYPHFESGGCGTIREYDGFELGCLVVPRRKIETRRNKVVQIVTPMVEQILIDLV